MRPRLPGTVPEHHNDNSPVANDLLEGNVVRAAEGATGGRKCLAFVHGDVACIVFDGWDNLALGGGCEGVPALREDVLRYSVKSRQATSQRRSA